MVLFESIHERNCVVLSLGSPSPYVETIKIANFASGILEIDSGL
jgi:hypothetical protein